MLDQRLQNISVVFHGSHGDYVQCDENLCHEVYYMRNMDMSALNGS